MILLPIFLMFATGQATDMSARIASIPSTGPAWMRLKKESDILIQTIDSRFVGIQPERRTAIVNAVGEVVVNLLTNAENTEREIYLVARDLEAYVSDVVHTVPTNSVEHLVGSLHEALSISSGIDLFSIEGYQYFDTMERQAAFRIILNQVIFNFLVPAPDYNSIFSAIAQLDDDELVIYATEIERVQSVTDAAIMESRLDVAPYSTLAFLQIYLMSPDKMMGVGGKSERIRVFREVAATADSPIYQGLAREGASRFFHRTVFNMSWRFQHHWLNSDGTGRSIYTYIRDRMSPDILSQLDAIMKSLVSFTPANARYPSGDNFVMMARSTPARTRLANRFAEVYAMENGREIYPRSPGKEIVALVLRFDGIANRLPENAIMRFQRYLDFGLPTLADPYADIIMMAYTLHNKFGIEILRDAWFAADRLPSGWSSQRVTLVQRLISLWVQSRPSDLAITKMISYMLDYRITDIEFESLVSAFNNYVRGFQHFEELPNDGGFIGGYPPTTMWENDDIGLCISWFNNGFQLDPSLSNLHQLGPFDDLVFESILGFANLLVDHTVGRIMQPISAASRESLASPLIPFVRRMSGKMYLILAKTPGTGQESVRLRLIFTRLGRLVVTGFAKDSVDEMFIQVESILDDLSHAPAHQHLCDLLDVTLTGISAALQPETRVDEPFPQVDSIVELTLEPNP